MPANPTPLGEALRDRAGSSASATRRAFPGGSAAPTWRASTRLAACFVFPSLQRGLRAPRARGDAPRPPGRVLLNARPCRRSPATPRSTSTRTVRTRSPRRSPADPLRPRAGRRPRRARPARAAQFTWRRTAEETLASFDRALAARERPAPARAPARDGPALPPSHAVRAAAAAELRAARSLVRERRTLRPERASPRARDRGLPASGVGRGGRAPPSLRRRDGARRDLLPTRVRASAEVRPRLGACAETAVDLGANIGLFGAWLLGRFPEGRSSLTSPTQGMRPSTAALDANGAGRPLAARRGVRRDPGTTSFHRGPTPPRTRAAARASRFPSRRRPARARRRRAGQDRRRGRRVADPRRPAVRRARLPAARPRVPRGRLPVRRSGAAAEKALRAAGFEIVHTQRKPAFGAGLVWGFRPGP